MGERRKKKRDAHRNSRLVERKMRGRRGAAGLLCGGRLLRRVSRIQAKTRPHDKQGDNTGRPTCCVVVVAGDGGWDPEFQTMG